MKKNKKQDENLQLDNNIKGEQEITLKDIK
jgi:hypothetical protein